MTDDAFRVEVDTRELEAGIRQLGRGLDAAGPRVASSTASSVASRLRGMVPVRTGRLRNTVTVSRLDAGAAVRYGGGLPYAGYIDGRTGATERATQGAPAAFHTAMTAAAATEVRKL